MTRQDKIDKMERAGFKVTILTNGICFATKLHREYRADSITALHKLIYGY